MRASLAERYGLLETRGSVVVAAVIAAHGASTGDTGFRLSDVRFFFYLFSNWLEQDLVQGTESLELTQVRRWMERLVERGWARPARARARGERSRFALTPTGLEELVDRLTAEVDRRTFEEGLLIACFAACYGGAIVARATPARRRDLAQRLSPDRLLQRVAARIDRVIADLEERVRSAGEMQSEARLLRQSGRADADVAAALDRRGAYQLQHVRSFGEVMGALPPDLLRFELTEGIALRGTLLFAPMLAQARAQRSVLAELRSALGPAVPSPAGRSGKRRS